MIGTRWIKLLPTEGKQREGKGNINGNICLTRVPKASSFDEKIITSFDVLIGLKSVGNRLIGHSAAG
jgi:hypothetical protein